MYVPKWAQMALKNSIRINELTPSKESANVSYVLIGASKDINNNLYIVRFVVNEYGNKLSSMDILYAINTKKNRPCLTHPDMRTIRFLKSILQLV